VHPAYLRIAQQVRNTEGQGALDEAVDHEAVLGRVNFRHAVVVPLKVQAAGRDRPVEGLDRRL
jgi:hypothetical protein